ncbi:MAG: hypothetical protein QM498_13040, partial [Desulfobacterium sp.]
PEKLITLCEDETFHPQTCLVAIEPESNYIILEKVAQNVTIKTPVSSKKRSTVSARPTLPHALPEP